MEFKGTKGDFEIVEHNWSDTSLMIGDKQIAFKSIYDEATEETQEELELEVMYNFLLLSNSKKMIETLHKAKYELEKFKEAFGQGSIMIKEIENVIKQSTELQ